MGSSLLVLIDGLRPDALSSSLCPNITNFYFGGAYTMKANSVIPSMTLPCHMSIFHSLDPKQHGVTTSTSTPKKISVPGLFEIAHETGLKCAFFYNWEKLRNISKPGSLFFSYFRDNLFDVGGDTVMIKEAVRYINMDSPDFAFLYLGTVDIAGEEYGWMTERYLQQVSRVDHSFGELLEGISNEYTVLLQSDHGGHDCTHGTDCPEDMTIPWGVNGPNVKKGYQIKSEVSLLDTAPTLARLLHIEPHPRWDGRCIEEIFEQGGNYCGKNDFV